MKHSYKSKAEVRTIHPFTSFIEYLNCLLKKTIKNLQMMMKPMDDDKTLFCDDTSEDSDSQADSAYCLLL